MAYMEGQTFNQNMDPILEQASMAQKMNRVFIDKGKGYGTQWSQIGSTLIEMSDWMIHKSKSSRRRSNNRPSIDIESVVKMYPPHI